MAEATQALAQQTGGETGGRSGQGRLGALVNEYLGDGAMRQLGLILGLAAAIAAGIGLFMWAQEPVYRSLFASLPAEDAGLVADALTAANIDYRLGNGQGSVMVPADKLHEARLLLASQGLPNTGGVGFESLREDQGFGTSRFMETARYHRALETELARTITNLRAVKQARVHLAIPERSVFLGDRRQPQASVTVGLHSGRTLTGGQVQAVAQMVASAVPELALERVTLVDQQGNLLTGNGGDGKGSGVDAAQLDYKHRVESAYVERIEELLAPILGEARVRAQVNARIDYSRRERTEEIYDPERTALRSEQSNENRSDRGDAAMGVPGALTNQPPGPGTLAQQGEGEGEPQSMIVDQSASATRNYEVSKTIRHIQSPRGAIERLSVAVLLDTPTGVDDEGNTVTQPMSAQRLDQLTALVRDAVGFDEARGDSVNVVSTEFRPQEQPQPLETPLWEQPWAIEGGKLLLAAVLGLVLILAVVRPLVNGLLGRDASPGKDTTTTRSSAPNAVPGGDAQDRPQLTGPEHQDAMSQHAQRQLGSSAPPNHAERLDSARQTVSREPALAANVVKGWLQQGNE